MRAWSRNSNKRPVRTDPDLTGSAASALTVESRLIQIELDPMKPPSGGGFKPVSNRFDPVYTIADRPIEALREATQ